MNKTVYFSLPLLLIASSLSCSDTTTTGQVDQTRASSEQSLARSNNPDQRSWLEKLKGAFEPSNRTTDNYNRTTDSSTNRGLTEGPTLGERASATGERAKVATKSFAQRAREAITGRTSSDYTTDTSTSRGLTEGPTLGERASATGQTAKNKAKGWMESLRETVSPRRSEDRYQRGYQEDSRDTNFGQRSTSDRDLSGNRNYDDRVAGTATGTRDSRNPGEKTWTQTWEDVKEGVARTFGADDTQRRTTRA